MLAVSVDLHDGVRSDLDRIAKAGPQGTADTEVDRQSDHGCSRLLGEGGRSIGAGIVDNHALVTLLADRTDDVGDAGLFVEGRNDDEDVCHVSSSRSLTRRARSACASAVVRNRSCSSDTLIESWIEMASNSTELIISSTAVGVMSATLPSRPTNGSVIAA